MSNQPVMPAEAGIHEPREAARPARMPASAGMTKRGVSSPGVQAGARGPRKPRTLRAGPPAWLQATPFSLVFLLFFIAPLALVAMVSFWNFNEYELLPGFTFDNYLKVFEGCPVNPDGQLCVTFATYLSTLKFCLLTWAITLVLGFAVAYFLAFHVRGTGVQTLLFLLCTIPFWTSNVIRMVSWVPLLGRHGLVNDTLMATGLIQQPLEWLLFSDFSVVLAFVHLYTMFMLVPIFNSMMRIDRSLLEASRDCGAGAWQTLWNVIVPLCKSGIVIGSIFVVTIVMGDFVTVGVMGGQQIASVGKVIQVQTSYLQFPLAAANAVILLATVLMIVWGLTRVVDIRREL
ncbi:ABC transporter permease [Azohydromonas australica]|uniref:ABC transporter permease n=1 Tax=Azohydromonas australica TaxID=364039 RepID=UPI0004269D53|nr:ABC transporter permease [Azohydromonas australica]